MNREWEMSFAESGAEALTILENQDVDVVVTDMKMPGMDGSQLLKVVSENFPRTIRIILSGYSERDNNMKTVATAHQYLSKPCDAQLLKATITRVCSLRDVLVGDHLRTLVSKLRYVPSIPTLYTQLVDELNGPEPSTRRIAEIVKKDIGMTGKVLQIVNSAFFGLRRVVSDPKEAVEFLGIETITAITLGIGVISQFERFKSGCSFSEIWSHSLSVGTMANKIASMEKREIAGEAFTAGLLHDIGNLVLAVNLPDQLDEVERKIIQEQIPRFVAEDEVFGTSHSEIGAYLLGLWGLPGQVVQAVAFHHRPKLANTDSFTPLTAVYIADRFHKFNDHFDPPQGEPEIDEEFLATIGMLDRLPDWSAHVVEEEVCA
jgi:HD-like signal output (HDOD) protein